MVDVDGVKYVSEKEFHNAVEKELGEIAHIIMEQVLDTGDVEAMHYGVIIAEAFGNLGRDLFKVKEDSDASTGD